MSRQEINDFPADCKKYRVTGNRPNGDQKDMENKRNFSPIYGKSNSPTTRQIALQLRSYYFKGPHIHLSS